MTNPSRLSAASLGFGGTGLLKGTDADAQALLECAVQSGVRFFDTAPFYGHGLSENRLGQAITACRLPRTRICTKVGVRLSRVDRCFTGHLHAKWPANHDLYAAPGYDEISIRSGFEESCLRLGVDHVDTLLLHGLSLFPAEGFANIATSLKAMDQLKAAGRVLRVGVAVNDLEMARAIAAMWPLDVLLLAGGMSINATEPAQDLADQCSSKNIEVIAAAPFGGQWLFQETPEMLMKLCQEYEVDLATAALQYPLRCKSVKLVLPSTSRPDRLKQMADQMGNPVPDAFWQRLSRAGLGPLG